MSEDNEYDWGTKKMKYYQMNKREDNEEENDSDFIEDEKEAIRLQKLRLEKIKKAKLLNEEEEESEEEEKKKEVKINKKDKKDNKEKKENEITFNQIEKDNKKIIENINLLKNCLEEYQTADDEIKILTEEKKMNLPKTLSYLKEYKNINILYSANILFNIISTLNNKMTGHHPSIKNSAIFNYLLTKNSDKNEQIQNNIEQILISLENKQNNKEINDEDSQDNIMGNEDKEDNIEEEEEEDIEENEEDEENEEENDELENIDKNKKKNLISNNLIINTKEVPKKPSFLNKKKKREKAEKEIDIKENENFDNESKDENNNIEDDEDENDDDSFIKQQYKSFNKIKKEKELLDIQKKENEKKDIDMKNNFAIRKANKEVLKARGIYRKRKRYQGNAKLMNREKFYKKEKQRKNMVKDYVGKPDVYSGEATGIRRDLIRSTKIH